MALTPIDKRLLAEVVEGLPLHPEPYRILGERLGINEAEVLQRLQSLQESGALRRMGVIVKHRRLGYVANAMVVWDIPDDHVREVAARMLQFSFVTLCYRRPRRLPLWPYNLFCMIHGRDRETVLQQIRQLTVGCGAERYPRSVLFSRKAFKQRGADLKLMEGHDARLG